jgi:hypothetical protein
MKHFRGRFYSISLALVALAIGSVAAAAGCGSPPDSSGNWQFVDDLALGMQLSVKGPVAYDVYSTVDREANFSSSTLSNVSLSWSGYTTTSYSASIQNWAGEVDSRYKETVRVTTDIPPMKEARLQVRKATRQDFYTFDAGCIWFNTQTHESVTAIAQYDVPGSITRTWNESSLSIRSAY